MSHSTKITSSSKKIGIKKSELSGQSDVINYDVTLKVKSTCFPHWVGL